MPIFNLAYGGVNTPTPPPTPLAQYTDWDSDVVDFVTQAFLDAGDELKGAIEYMFGYDFVFTIQDDLGIDLSEWIYEGIYIGGGSRYGLQISDGGDMTDRHELPESPSRYNSICIVRDNDDLSDAEYIVGTYDPNDDGFDYQLSSLASHFDGKDTVCMFIFNP